MSGTTTAYDFDFRHCQVPNQILAGPPWVALLGATISITCYLYVVAQCYLYKTAEFVGHPTSMAVYKYMMEAVFVIQFFVISFKNDPKYYYSDTYFYDRRIPCPVDECCASQIAVSWAFVTQFCLLSSELWFAAICRDLQLAYTNPFSSYQENKRFFAIAITVVSLCSSFGLIYIADPYQIGVSEQGFVWVQSQFRNFYNPVAIQAYFAWFYLLLVYSIYTIFRYGGGEDMNLAGTVSTRLPIMKKGRRFVLGYCSFWCLVVIVEFAYLFATDAIGTDKPQNYSMLGYCLAFRGPYALAIIIFSNWESMTWQKAFPFWYAASGEGTEKESLSGVAEKLALAPHLNKALRAEILFFTSEGIRVSALENLARRRLEKRNRQANGGHLRSGSNSSDTSETIISSDTYQYSSGKLENKISRVNGSNAALGVGSEAEHDGDEDMDIDAGDLAFLEDLEQEELEKDQTLTTSSHAGKDSRDKMRTSYTRESYIFSISDAPARRVDSTFKKTLFSMEEGGVEGSATSVHSERPSVAFSADRFSSRNAAMRSSVSAAGRSSMTDSAPNRGSTSMRASLDEAQLGRLSMLENRQEQALEEMVDSYIADHIPSEQDQVGGGDGGGKSSLSNLRASLDRRRSGSAPGNSKNCMVNSLAMETLSEGPSDEDRSESFSSEGLREDESGIEMKDRRSTARPSHAQRTTSTVSLGEGDESWRDSGASSATIAASHDASTRGGSKDPRDTIAKPAAPRHAEQDVTHMSSQQMLHDTEWRVRCSRAIYREFDEPIMNRNYTGTASGDQERSIDSGDTESVNTALSRIMAGAERAKTQILSLFQQSLYDFEFIDYCPRLFCLVRRLCGISETEYAAAFESVTGENFSEGRSGAFTFFSKNGEFFVKAQTLTEIQSLREMLPSYVRYLSKNRSSLLIKFLGAHQIKMYGKEMYFVIMCNVFPKDAVIHERYDLKGSWVRRHGNSGVFVTGHGEVMKKESPLYLDNDIHQSIELHPAAANAIFRQLKSDAQFLAAQGLMDYSLLVGVVKARMEVLDNVVPGEYSDELLKNLTRDNPFLLDSSGGLRPICVEGAATYYVGMIDLLQRWDIGKKVEYWFKTLVLGWDKEGVSAIDPQKYCSRFVNRVTKKLFVGIHGSGEGVTHDRMAGEHGRRSSAATSRVSHWNGLGPSASRGARSDAARESDLNFINSESAQGDAAERMSPIHDRQSSGIRLKTDLYPAKSPPTVAAHKGSSAGPAGVDISSSKNRGSVSVRLSVKGGAMGTAGCGVAGAGAGAGAEAWFAGSAGAASPLAGAVTPHSAPEFYLAESSENSERD